jgi:hypothetical protein
MTLAGRLGFVVCVAAACLLRAGPAVAQQYILGADVNVSSGLEGGGPNGPTATRTRLRLGGDLRIDESPDDIFQVGLLAELLPKSGFGADLRYARAVGEHYVLDAGGIAILAPSSLYGATAGLTYRLSLSKKTQIELGPEGDFYFLGTDLPDGVVIWQIRFLGGFRADL